MAETLGTNLLIGTCIDLALEGERKCKSGDCRTGVKYFEAAIKAGTEDLKTLSAVYSQLGNAYFYLKEYEKALEFHRHDLTLARTLGDRLGEAKASGNLGNTLKVLGKFDEAIFCCTRHLDTSKELKDKIGEARALYNLGNIYHAKGKHLGRSRHRDPGDFPEDVRLALERAVEFYEANLLTVTEIGDRAAEGRAYGNLGNTHYLLGNFEKAIQYHEQRLIIAHEFDDRAAERRAFSNLGNAHVFIGEFEIAAEYYKKTRELATELQDSAIEAQACYSLGNTFTLLKNYELALEYHQAHLVFAMKLCDRVGEGRAYWSLGNACTALGRHKLALEYAEKHLEISKEVGDRTGELTAEMNIADLKAALGLPGASTTRQSLSTPSLLPGQVPELSTPDLQVARSSFSSQNGTDAGEIRVKMPHARSRLKTDPDGPGEDLFDLIARIQTPRMNDQRSEPPSLKVQKSQAARKAKEAKEARPISGLFLKPEVPSVKVSSKSTENLIEMLSKAQGSRLEEQRCSLPELPGLSVEVRERLIGRSVQHVPDDSFLDMLIRCQAARIDDQRCELPSAPRGPTVPDEDFFNLIVRFQSNRLDAQRVSFEEVRKHSV